MKKIVVVYVVLAAIFAGNNSFGQSYVRTTLQVQILQDILGMVGLLLQPLLMDILGLWIKGNTYINGIYHNVIRKINTAGIISTIAGT